MWWLLTVGAFVVLVLFAALYAEFGPGASRQVRARETSTDTNYAILRAMSDGRRNTTTRL